MVTWIVFHEPPLGGKPTTKPGDHGTPTLTTVDLFYGIMCENPTCIGIHWNSIRSRAGHIWLHTTLEGPWPHYYMNLMVRWDGLCTLSFGLSQFSRSWLLARVWSLLEDIWLDVFFIEQCPGRFLDIINQKPSVTSKSNRLHISTNLLVLIWGIFCRFLFKWWVIFPEVLRELQPVISQTQPGHL